MSSLNSISSEGRLTLPAGRVAPSWMVTARSYLIDRMVPDCEEIRLPAKSFGGGELSFRLGPLVAEPPPDAGLAGLGRRLARRRRCHDGGGLLVDLRRRSPGNWAHFLTNHLPIMFALSQATGLAPTRLQPVLPRRTPGHVLHAARLFGFEPLLTNDTVEGSGIAYAVEPWTAPRAIRRAWALSTPARSMLDAAGLDGPSERPLPARVFLSRRDTRRLRNEAEISRLLAARGFETLYAEDLPVPDQFRLLERAEAIVAIHGAALGPLLWRSASAPPARIMELFPCGHVTDVWRALAQQAGCAWIGVRGLPRPEHIRPAHDLGKPFVRYSLQDFEVDPASVERAFEILENETFHTLTESAS